MFNPRTNFEVSTITCYEDMKGNAKCRNCGGLGWLRVTQGHRLNFAKTFGVSLWGTVWHCLRDLTCSHFSRTQTCISQTDRHTTTANIALESRQF